MRSALSPQPVDYFPRVLAQRRRRQRHVRGCPRQPDHRRERLDGADSGVILFQQDLARFKLEYDTVSRLKHPSVVEIDGYGTAGEHAYIAMEYFPDGSLMSRMRKGMTLDDAVTYSRQRGREV